METDQPTIHFSWKPHWRWIVCELYGLLNNKYLNIYLSLSGRHVTKVKLTSVMAITVYGGISGHRSSFVSLIRSASIKFYAVHKVWWIRINNACYARHSIARQKTLHVIYIYTYIYVCIYTIPYQPYMCVYIHIYVCMFFENVFILPGVWH